MRGRFLSNRVLFTMTSHEGLTHSLFYLAKPFTLFDSRWTPFKFENALKLTKLTQLFVQDQLIQKFVPTAETMWKVFTFSDRRLKDLEPLRRWSKMLVRRIWLLYLPILLWRIPLPAWCFWVGQLDPLKVGESRSLISWTLTLPPSHHDLAWQHYC